MHVRAEGEQRQRPDYQKEQRSAPEEHAHHGEQRYRNYRPHDLRAATAKLEYYSAINGGAVGRLRTDFRRRVSFATPCAILWIHVAHDDWMKSGVKLTTTLRKLRLTGNYRGGFFMVTATNREDITVNGPPGTGLARLWYAQQRAYLKAGERQMARNDAFDHSDDQRRASADPRINPDNDPNAYRHVGDQQGRVAPLDDLDDFKVADNEPDPRGWKVRSSDNKTVGKVKNLIADSGAMKVRYLEIDLDKKELNLDDDRRVLVPIGAARLNDDDDVVVIDRPSADFAALPEYKKDKWNRNYENELRTAWSRGGSTGATRSTSTSTGDSDFYAHDHFNDRNFFGNRRAGRENEAYIARSGSEMGRGNPESKR